MSYAIIRSIFC